jgi:hypothetical protein
MTMFQNGGAQPGTLADNTSSQAWTPGKRVAATGRVTPCSVDGEKCDFIFNDTIEAVENGFGVGLLTLAGGGHAIAGLAWGAVNQGDEVIVKMSIVDDLPKFASADAEGTEGDYIVGRVIYGSATTEDVADTYGAFNPSLAIQLFPEAQQIVGAT